LLNLDAARLQTVSLTCTAVNAQRVGNRIRPRLTARNAC
jgi:hypothetical protein